MQSEHSAINSDENEYRPNTDLEGTLGPIEAELLHKFEEKMSKTEIFGMMQLKVNKLNELSYFLESKTHNLDEK